MAQRNAWEEDEWRAPSGRAPRPERPLSLKAMFARALRTAPGRSERARKAASAVTAPDQRRVTVKVRVVQVGADWGKKAAKLHLAYIERDGVQQDGSAGMLYGAEGRASRADLEGELPGEQHQFRIVISPEDAHELDLDAYVRTYMQRVERDLGQKLHWAAVNHYNTDNPHAHVVIRGVDVEGNEVRMAREYVSHGLRHRAAELATEELGPRPERSRIEQLQREANLERFTSLDATLERRAKGGLVELGKSNRRDPHLGGALKKRLAVLEALGLASAEKGGRWKLSPELRPALQRLQQRAEALRIIGGVLDLEVDRCRIIDRDEPSSSHRQELERGVQGVIRWKGLDEQGRFCVVVETTDGHAYHLPITNRVAQNARVGQIVEVQRAADKDAEIERVARHHGWQYDLGKLSELQRRAYEARLEQLERMGLVHRDSPSTEQWTIRPDFRAELAKGKQQPYWQHVGVRLQSQRLDAQVTYEGYVWLDRVRLDQLGRRGFGDEVDAAVRRRYEYLRGLGLQPRGENLRWDLQRRQQQRLERSIAAREGGRSIRPGSGFEGTVRLHRESNGETFLEVSARGQFFVRPASRADEALEGQRARVLLGDKGRIQLERIEKEPGRER